MKQERDGRFELQPVLRSAMPEVAAFLHGWHSSGFAGSPTVQESTREAVGSIERRLRWLLLDNPAATIDSPLGYCLRDDLGVMRGLDLCFPVAFLHSDNRLLGLCSGTFLVEPGARSLGFYLFKKSLRIPGYSFYFASTCNTNSSELWRSIGARPVPNSETEYVFPLRLDVMVAAYVAYRASSQVATRILRTCGRGANPILRFFTRSSAKLAIEPCQDWQKLSELYRRHRSPHHVTSDRSPAFLQWRYGPGSPSHPCDIYLVRDTLGNEGWFSLGQLKRGRGAQFRASVLLDAIWPRKQMNYKDLFREMVRVATIKADALCFRWRPELDYSELTRFAIPHKFEAPRAFVSVPKAAPRFPLELLDYDDSDYIAWAFPWRDE